MNIICSLNHANNFVFNKNVILLFLSIFSFSFLGNSQLVDLEVSGALSSGIIQQIDASHDEAIVQFKIVNLDLEIANEIRKELTKYEGDITGYGQGVLDGKIIVSYKSPFIANSILAILNRVNIIGYYDLAGENTYFVKDANSFFIR